MLVSINWLRDYAEIDVPVEEFCDRMILSGSNIETVEPYGTKFSGIVVGKILRIEKHPDADRLVVCSVDVGEEEPIQIVTGAKNVFEGATVPVIRSGGYVPGCDHQATPDSSFDNYRYYIKRLKEVMEEAGRDI